MFQHFKKIFHKIKEYFQRSNLLKMTKEWLKNIKTKKIGEIGEIFKDLT